MLGIIEEGKTSRTIEPNLSIFEGRILQTKAVRTLSRFDVNYARAKVRQVLADARSGSIGAELNHLNVVERILRVNRFVLDRPRHGPFCALPNSLL